MAVLNKRAVVSAIEMYGVSAIRLPMVLGESFAQIIKSLFANSEQGFAYDPNDLTTMFQDAAGTVPVTGVGQPVGLLLDKSKGLVLGPERISGGDFANGLIGTVQDGNGSVSTWELNNTSPISGVSDGKLTVTTPATFRPMLAFTANAPKLAGSAYTVSFNYKVISGSPIVALVSSGGRSAIVNIPISGSGKFTYTYVSGNTSTTEIIYFSSAAGYSLQIDNVSCKQVLGNHAYQDTSASRPILRQNATTGAYYLEFDGVDDRLVTDSFPSMGSATTIFAGSYCSKALTAAIAARGAVGYLYQTSGTVAVQSVNNPITLLQSGNTVITAKYAASGTGVTLKANNLSNTNPNTSERGFRVSNPLIVGAFDSNGSAPFLGHIYSLIGVSRLTTDAESIVIEREIAKRLGVTLSV